MQFEIWLDWINNYTNGETYCVTDLTNQIVTINGKSVDVAWLLVEMSREA